MSAPHTTTSTHLPGQFLEVAEALQSAELNIPVETRPNNISLAFDAEALTVTVTATIPLGMNGGSNSITFVAADYLA